MVKEVMKKVILLGDGAVGKTSLIRRYVDDQYSDDYIFTIGTKVTKKELTVKSGDEDVMVNMVIWDILGQTDFHRTQSEAFKGASGALLVADITRKETLDSLEKYWIPQFEKEAGKVPIIFLANKSDLKNEAKFTDADLANTAKKHKGSEEIAKCFLTSAKNGLNVEKAFESLAMSMIKK